MLGFGLLVWCGCAGVGPGISANSILIDEIQDLLTQYGIDPNIVTIRIINQTDLTEELEVLVDDLPQIISCTPAQGICDVPLLTCPQRIEVVQERRLDISGGYQGGRIFHGNPEYIFLQSEGEFQCGSIIVFLLTEFDIQTSIL
ncbi:MAG: hypothetical protein JSV03_12660 [Planctomycetota bacterium]|nr:MAG: hypothetical protein JSV03_12660 [Planctomycetota bacterium]